MSLKNSLYKQYQTLISHWPVDHLRLQLSFQNFLRHRIDHEFGVTPPSAPTAPAAQSAVTRATGELQTPQNFEFNEECVARQLNALSTLLGDRYKSLYPVTAHTLKPKGQPEYYERLLAELEIAPKRTWLQRQINSWKGWIRMK